jgi:hypothetical protein
LRIAAQRDRRRLGETLRVHHGVTGHLALPRQAGVAGSVLPHGQHGQHRAGGNGPQQQAQAIRLEAAAHERGAHVAPAVGDGIVTTTKAAQAARRCGGRTSGRSGGCPVRRRSVGDGDRCDRPHRVIGCATPGEDIHGQFRGESHSGSLCCN